MAGALKVRTSINPDVWETLGGGSFATAEEVVAGTNDTKAITPSGLKAKMTHYDVREYGAKLDGVADDTAAFQAMIDAIRVAGTITGGIVELPINSTIRLTGTLQINQMSLIIQGAGRGKGGTTFKWDGVAGLDMFRIIDSSNVEFRDFNILGKSGAEPRSAFHFENPTNTTVGTNERLGLRNIAIGRVATYVAPYLTPLQRGVLVDGAFDGNNDQMLFYDVDAHDCSVACFQILTFQSIWSLFQNCFFDSSAIGLDTQAGVTMINATFNRCVLDIRADREMIVQIFGYYSENTGKCFEFTRSAQLDVNGGKIVFTNVMAPGTPHWGTFTSVAINSGVRMRGLRVYDGRSPATASPILQFIGASSAVAPGWVSIRQCMIPLGDSPDAYDVDAYAASGIHVDIKQGDYEHIGFANTLNATGRLGGNLMRRSTYNAIMPLNAIAETCDRRTVGGALTVTAGTLFMSGIPLPRGAPIANIVFASAATVSAGLTNWWFGLFDANRVCLGLTADQLAATWPANTVKSLALTAPVTIPADGLYFLGLMVAGTTPPNFQACLASNALLAIAPNISASTSNTGMTTPPTLPFTANAFAVTRPGMQYGYVT